MGFSTRIAELLCDVKYKDNWSLSQGYDGERQYLQWHFTGPCAVTGIIERHPCRKWYLSEHMVDGEVVQTAFMAALAAEEHECREFFKYKDKRVFGPHIRLEALMAACEDIEVRK
jgi:hypothetical protein